jgi:PBSX family phage terminase large subunit
MVEENKEIKLTPFYYDHVLAQQYKVIIQVGGRFSSKSYNSEIEMAGNLASKERYKLLVIEDLEGGLTKGYYAGLKDKIEQFGQDRAYSMTKSPAQITNLINKNVALFSGYATDQQKKAVKAIDQVTEIIVEEGEWLVYDDFVSLLHQLRGGRSEDRRLNILMNPVNPNCFVNEMFIETSPDRIIAYFPGTNRPKVFEKNIETTFEYEGQTVTDITKVLIALSTHHDNPFLTIDQRASIEVLKETDYDKYLQLGEARFIRSSSVYFPEFKRETHVIEPFVISSDWRRYRVIDYGLDMLACYWIATDTSNKAYVYKELYQSNLIISEAAKAIRSMTLDSENIYQTIAPPDLWNRRQETGKSAAELFQNNGLYLQQADNNRLQGWLNLKEWLKPYDDEQLIKTANLVIFSNCVNLIRCLSQILRDEKEPNDCATEPHELTHSCDAIRYWIAGRPVSTVIKSNPRSIETYIELKPTSTGGHVTW